MYVQYYSYKLYKEDSNFTICYTSLDTCVFPSESLWMVPDTVDPMED